MSRRDIINNLREAATEINGINDVAPEANPIQAISHRLTRQELQVVAFDIITKARGGRIDRVIEKYLPTYGAKRADARLKIARQEMALSVSGGYDAASRSKPQYKNWNPADNDVDDINTWDRPTLLARVRDLERNNALARGAINTDVTCVVGGGLRCHPRIDRNVLRMEEDAADAWERSVKTEWERYFGSVECDASRVQSGYAVQALALRRRIVDGDVLALFPYIEREGEVFGTKCRLVEGDRVCNPGYSANTDTQRDGVVKDADGAVTAYHVYNGKTVMGRYSRKPEDWKKVDAFGPDGRRNAVLLYDLDRPGQTRGISRLAPVVGLIHQLGKFTEAEIYAAVINSYFTMFLKSPAGADDGWDIKAAGGASAAVDKTTAAADLTLGVGGIHFLPDGYEAEFADPKRPNVNFEAFVVALLRQVGMALEIPFEVLVKHFTSSYSASRAALLEAWRHFLSMRSGFVNGFCRAWYANWMDEAVARGIIYAPGYWSSPQVRWAYQGSAWIGPTKGMIDELKEVLAAEKRMEIGLTTLEDETATLTGGDWESNHEQQKKEITKRREDGLLPSQAGTATDPGPTDADQPAG